MDKSLKLLIAVLGVAGLLALLVPSSVSTPPPAPAVEVAATAVAAPVIAAETTEEVLDVEEEEIDPADDAEEEFFKFGEPTIDGKPYGSSDDTSNNGNDNLQANPVAAIAPGPQPDQTAPNEPAPTGNY
jgi:hypothetical protein